nr:MAG TPA: hypothetical protein [Inoviridae sp.]
MHLLKKTSPRAFYRPWEYFRWCCRVYRYSLL